MRGEERSRGGGNKQSPVEGLQPRRRQEELQPRMPLSPPTRALSPPRALIPTRAFIPSRAHLARLRVAWAPERPERLGARLPRSPSGRAWPSD
jgi:hypothetical protein